MKNKKDNSKLIKGFLIFFAISLLFYALFLKLVIEPDRQLNKPEVVNAILTLNPSPSPSQKPVVNDKAYVTKPPLPVLNGGNIFNLVNQYRNSNGLQFLSVSNELCSIAEVRADYMMANHMQAFKESNLGNHSGFDNISANYSGNEIGENLAANATKDINVLNIWKNSPPHNELMLTTIRDSIPVTKGCVATRVSEVGSIVVLLVGDK